MSAPTTPRPRPRPRYYLEIDCSDRECSRFEPRWANYDSIVCEGNTLDECLDNASISIMDQDGGELWCGPADEDWMQAAVKAEFLSDPDRAHGYYEAEQRRDLEASDELLREDGI